MSGSFDGFSCHAAHLLVADRTDVLAELIHFWCLGPVENGNSVDQGSVGRGDMQYAGLVR
ncbi:hypothetical protein [Streptomyces sp. UC4497]